MFVGLLKKTMIGESSISGFGLFALEKINKGEVIWQFNPSFDRLFTAEEFEKIDGYEKAFLNTYCYKFKNEYILCADNAKYINHSFSPNTIDTPYETLAAMDIEPGEEITSDYRAFGVSKEDEDFNMKGLG